MSQNYQKVIDNPGEWIITRRGDFIRIKDSEKLVDKNLELIRKKLKLSGRFKEKTLEQTQKERYDKVLEEVNFDYDKFHDWLYEAKNQDRIEMFKREEIDYQKVVQWLFMSVEKDIAEKKWRIKKVGGQKAWINEETGQVVYYSDNAEIKHVFDWVEISKFHIPLSTESGSVDKGNYDEVVIFLHGTYGAVNNFPDIEKNFPSTKFIYPNSPTLQYDMWHGSEPKPGGQCKGWINITGDAWEIMEADVCPNNNIKRETFAEVDDIIHLDYSQLMRAASYINEIIEQEIANGISPEKIVIAGYSQGGLLTLATALTSQYRLGGFISLCGLLPCSEKLLKITEDKNKETPTIIINNSKDYWVPFWTGKKTYEILKDRDYNVKFKTHPGLGHAWKNKDIEKFLSTILKDKKTTEQERKNLHKLSYHSFGRILLIFIIIFLIVGIIYLIKKLRRKIKFS